MLEHLSALIQFTLVYPGLQLRGLALGLAYLQVKVVHGDLRAVSASRSEQYAL